MESPLLDREAAPLQGAEGAIDANRIHVRDLEAINGTPILDVKPILDLSER